MKAVLQDTKLLANVTLREVTNDWSLEEYCRRRCFAHARCTVGAITLRLREPIPLARRSLYVLTRASAHPNIRLLIRALAFVTMPTAASRLAYLIFLRLSPMFRLYFPFLHLVNKFTINNVLPWPADKVQQLSSIF